MLCASPPPPARTVHHPWDKAVRVEGAPAGGTETVGAGRSLGDHIAQPRTVLLYPCDPEGRGCEKPYV